MNHTLIVMAGPSGVGKSVMANVIADSHSDCVIVSRDKIRFSLLQDGEDYFTHEDDVVRNYYDALNSMLQTHEYVIADATHATKKARRQLFANVNTKNIRVVGVWIEVPLEVALKQNAARSGRARVDDEVVKRMYRYKVSPQKEEGFDEVIFISGHTDQAASDSVPFISNIFDKLQAI